MSNMINLQQVGYHWISRHSLVASVRLSVVWQQVRIDHNQIFIYDVNYDTTITVSEYTKYRSDTANTEYGSDIFPEIS